MNEEFRKSIGSFYSVCNTLDKNVSEFFKENGLTTSLKELVKTELSLYLIHLSVMSHSDETEELSFINSFFDIDKAEGCMENKSSDEFITTVPFCIRLLVTIDNAIHNKSIDGSFLGEKIDVFSVLLCKIYNILGKEFILCENDITETQISFYKKYNRMIKAYVEENLSFDLKAEADREEKLLQSEAEKDEETLEELLQQLDNLTGLKEIKKRVHNLIKEYTYFMSMNKPEKEQGNKPYFAPSRFAFAGNPGTGKTTVAILLAKIYKKLGILSRGQIVHVCFKDMLSPYIGQTPARVQEIVESAAGGTLIIDELCSFNINSENNCHNFYVDLMCALIEAIGSYREDILIIVTGYPDQIEEFFDLNHGLRPRFDGVISFEDYKPDELVEIFKGMCKKRELEADTACIEHVRQYFNKEYYSESENFFNVRAVRIFFQMAMANHLNRLTMDTDITNEELELLTYEDVKDITL